MNYSARLRRKNELYVDDVSRSGRAMFVQSLRYRYIIMAAYPDPMRKALNMFDGGLRRPESYATRRRIPRRTPITFEGKIGRVKFLGWLIVSALVAAAFIFFIFKFPRIANDDWLVETIGFAGITFAFYILASAAAKRFHDMGQSGWHCIWLFVAPVTVFAALYLVLVPTRASTATKKPRPFSERNKFTRKGAVIFGGRIGRSKYLGWLIAAALIVVAPALMGLPPDFVAGPVLGWLVISVSVVAAPVILVSATARRLRDMDVSPWFSLLLLVGFLNVIVLSWLLVSPRRQPRSPVHGEWNLSLKPPYSPRPQ
jgi:uncharacterized membrane protein YhaH (DUF805 family)